MRDGRCPCTWQKSLYSREENRRVPMLRKSISDYGCVSGGRPRFGEGGRRGEHKEKPIEVQGATGEHKEQPGFGSEGAGRRGSIRKSQVSIRKSPVRIRAETVSIKKSREHKGRDPQHKKHTMPFHLGTAVLTSGLVSGSHRILETLLLIL